MAQRLGSLPALSRPIGPSRVRLLACRNGRRMAVVRARVAVAKNMKARSGELVGELFSIAGAARMGSPLVEERQEQLDGVLQNLKKSCAPNPSRNPLLPANYQLLWASRPTAGPIAVAKQTVSIEQGGAYTNIAALGGILPGSAKQYGTYKATGANTYEVVFERIVIDKGLLGKEEIEESRDKGYRKFQILHLSEDALVLKALAPQRDPPTLLVFKRLAQKSAQKAGAGTTKIGGNSLKPSMTRQAVAASEKNRAEKSKNAAKIIAEKQAAKQKAIAAAEKNRAEKSRQAALLIAEKEAQKKAAKAKAEQEAREAAREAERQKKEKAAALLREKALKEKIAKAVEAQASIVADAQSASRAAVQALRYCSTLYVFSWQLAVFC
eukprot:evm.model.scf_116.2 EVM.evm.TU.scf_116.2   scf_116:7051-13440(+)